MEAASEILEGPRESPRRASFDDRFFRTILPERIQRFCPGHGVEVPVVLLELADGRSLDVCHIDLLTPEWMAVSAFRDKPSCSEMDVVFVPYEWIALVTISRRSSSQRTAGFQIGKDRTDAEGGPPHLHVKNRDLDPAGGPGAGGAS